MRVLFVMDPPAGIDPAGDTTTSLMKAAAAAGHQLWMCELHQLEAAPAPLALARPIEVLPWFTVDGGERMPIELFEAVFVRSDPPFDERYLWAMHVLDLADRQRTLLINDPAGIRAANEKLYALRFPELVPATLISADRAAIARFVAERGAAVIKPLDGHAGRGVLQLRRGDPNQPSILDLQTRFGARPVVVQERLDATAGNRRIFMLDGEPLAAVNRLPAAGDFRTGDVAEVVELSPAERRLCAAVGPALVRDGLRFVGLDVLGGCLIEVNVTSPGGVRQLERLSGRAYSREIVSQLLAANPAMEVTA